MRKKTIWDLNRVSIDDYKTIGKLPYVVVVDNVRSLNNIGSIFRTADAFLVESIYLCGISATPPAVEIHKTALGAEKSVNWHYFNNTDDCIAKLKNEGYKICVVEQVNGSVTPENIALSENEKYALVIGNEVDGVLQSVVDMADICLEIPQYGTKHSLNVSISAGIIMWEFFKNLSFIHKD